MVKQNYLNNRVGQSGLKIILLLIFTLVSAEAFAATIKVDVDRNPVEVNESFTVNFTANEAVDGQPDFRPLEENFKIISRNQSSNIQIINGRMSRQTQWSLYVMPKRTGKLWIPSIAFGDDQSSRLMVTVNSAKPQPADKGKSILYLEAEVDKGSVYVQAQLVYTVRIYQAVNLLNASLSDLTLNDTDAIVEKVGEDKTFNKRINGRRYKVFEKRYIIFPQKSGTLTISPAELEAQYVDDRRALRTKVLQSDPINIEVKPKPMVQTVQNNVWLPARRMQIKEEWHQEPPVFNVGEPVTRTITLVAEGLSAAQLPEVNMGQMKDMKQYLDQPEKEDEKSDTGVVGMRQEKIALIPTKTGNYIIPAIEIPWWNTEEDRLEYLRLPKKEITVNPGTQTAQQDAGKTTVPEAPPTIATAGTTQNQQQQPPGQADPKPDVPTEPHAGAVPDFWKWVSFVAIGGWLITGLAWWWFGRRSSKTTESTLKSLPLLPFDEKKFAKQLKEACDQHDAQAAKNALLGWGKRLWPEQSPGNLNELSRITGGTLGAQLLILNTHLYSDKSAPWDSTHLWQAFNRFEKQPEAPQAMSGDLLPLYRTTV